MTKPPPPNVDLLPWYRTGCGVRALILLGFLAVVTVLVAIQPSNWDKSIGFSLTFLWLGILLETGMVITVARRTFWRVPTSTDLDVLLTSLLIVICTVGIFGFCFLTCNAAIRP